MNTTARRALDAFSCMRAFPDFDVGDDTCRLLGSLPVEERKVSEEDACRRSRMRARALDASARWALPSIDGNSRRVRHRIVVICTPLTRDMRASEAPPKRTAA